MRFIKKSAGCVNDIRQCNVFTNFGGRYKKDRALETFI